MIRDDLGLRKRLFSPFGEPLLPGSLLSERSLISESLLSSYSNQRGDFGTSYYKPSLTNELEMQQISDTLGKFHESQRWYKDQLSIANPEFKGFCDYLQQSYKDLLKCELKFLESLAPEMRGLFKDRIEEIRRELRD